ncbi:hypothetical protein B0H13DRAFT_2665702 [Mycena leptocephala]|nr:hypothetical protein B0H13DRAFT_2665702 [Mycena leptocephala]
MFTVLGLGLPGGVLDGVSNSYHDEHDPITKLLASSHHWCHSPGMHPALKLDNLSRLPTPIRTIATKAANGSLQDLVRLFPLICREHQSEFIPVCYVNLNPNPNDDDDVAINRAYVALRALRFLHIPVAAGVDLWPRIWKWISFLLSRWPTQADLSFDLLFFVGQLVYDPPSLALIDKTAGVHYYLMAAATRVLLKLNLTQNPSDLEEVTEGAGGNLVDFLNLITQYVDGFIPTTRSPVSAETHRSMDPVIFAIDHLDLEDPALRAAQLASEYIPSLVRIMCAFSRYSGPYVPTKPSESISCTDDFLGDMLIRVVAWCHRAPQDRIFRRFLSAGILRAIVGYAIRGIEVKFTSMLLKTLACSTVYLSVLLEMDAGFQDAEDLIADPAFPKSAIFGEWTAFRTLANECIALAKSWQSAERVTRKACDNMECGAIRPKADFQCCGHRHSVYYCSRLCQRGDWKRAEHRLNCPFLRSSRWKDPDPLLAQDLSFMRALLHYDYQTNKPETMYVESSLLPEFVHVNCIKHVSRALRSKGRMDMHMMLVPDGKGTFLISSLRPRMFPMHSDTAVLHEGVRMLAAENPEPPNLTQRIQQLLDATSAIVEIH